MIVGQNIHNLYENKRNKNKKLFLVVAKIITTKMDKSYKLVDRVGGYCGLNKHVSFSVFKNYHTNTEILMVNYDYSTDCDNIWFRDNKSIQKLYKIINWLKDNGSKVKSFDNDPYVLMGVRFTTGKYGYWLEVYGVNPYTEFENVNIDDLEFTGDEIDDIKGYIISLGCQIEHIEM